QLKHDSGGVGGDEGAHERVEFGGLPGACGPARTGREDEFATVEQCGCFAASHDVRPADATLEPRVARHKLGGAGRELGDPEDVADAGVRLKSFAHIQSVRKMREVAMVCRVLRAKSPEILGTTR